MNPDPTVDKGATDQRATSDREVAVDLPDWDLLPPTEPLQRQPIGDG